jgi:hypothetical protein
VHLSQRLPIAKGGVVGLKAHLAEKHRGCPADTKVRCDYHGDGEQPEDFVLGCPARYHEPALREVVYEMISWEDAGGLSTVSGRPMLALPARLVAFYREAIQARDRFLAWRDRATAKALEKK